MRTITLKKYLEIGKKRFGKSALDWPMICPRCGAKMTCRDYIDSGITKEDLEGILGFSCIGRFDNNKGCNWTLGGLLQIHTLEIITEDGKHHPRFELAEA